MKVKVINDEGTARVQIIDPTVGEPIVGEETVEEGHEVELIVESAHAPRDIQVCDVVPTSIEEPESEEGEDGTGQGDPPPSEQAD